MPCRAPKRHRLCHDRQRLGERQPPRRPNWVWTASPIRNDTPPSPGSSRTRWTRSLNSTPRLPRQSTSTERSGGASFPCAQTAARSSGLMEALADETQREAERSRFTFCEMRSPLNIPSLRELARIVNARDRALLDILHGMPLVGSALCSRACRSTGVRHGGPWARRRLGRVPARRLRDSWRKGARGGPRGARLQRFRRAAWRKSPSAARARR